MRNIFLGDPDFGTANRVFNLGDADEDDHIIVDGKGLVANGTEVESESDHCVRLLNSFRNPTGPQIQVTVFSQNGQFSNIWGMSTDTPLIEGARSVEVAARR